MTRSSEVEVKVGLFVALGTGLIMFTILLLGGGSVLLQGGLQFHTTFDHVGGMIEGANVKIAGVKVGQIEKIRFNKETGKVDVFFSVQKKFREAIKEDSLVATETQGVLGDRYLVVSTGSPSAVLAKDGAELKSNPPKDIKDYLSGADEVIDRLKNSLSHMEQILGAFERDSRAENFFRNMSGFSSNVNQATTQLPTKMKDMYAAMTHFDSILKKVDNGQGTLGALVNDPSLYDDMKALLGGANRNKVLKYFIKQSVDETKEAQKPK